MRIYGLAVAGMIGGAVIFLDAKPAAAQFGDCIVCKGAGVNRHTAPVEPTAFFGEGTDEHTNPRSPVCYGHGHNIVDSGCYGTQEEEDLLVLLPYFEGEAPVTSVVAETLAMIYPHLVTHNESRGLLQLHGCDGRSVIAQQPLPGSSGLIVTEWDRDR